jgi:hypothetical protein
MFQVHFHLLQYLLLHIIREYLLVITKLIHLVLYKTIRNILLFHFFQFHHLGRPNMMEMFAYDSLVLSEEHDDHVIQKVSLHQLQWHLMDYEE